VFSKSGKSRFNVCSHKELTVDDTSAQLTCPKTVGTGTEVKVDPYAFYDERNVHQRKGGDKDDAPTKENLYRNRTTAVQELAYAAGNMVCKGCPFYKMSRVDVNTTLAQEARTHADLLAAQAAEVQQNKLYLDAVLELNNAHPNQAALPPVPEQGIAG
jgi:hypothetical protein